MSQGLADNLSPNTASSQTHGIAMTGRVGRKLIRIDSRDDCDLFQIIVHLLRDPFDPVLLLGFGLVSLVEHRKDVIGRVFKLVQYLPYLRCDLNAIGFSSLLSGIGDPASLEIASLKKT